MLSFVPINYHRCWPRSWKRCLRHVIEAVLGSLSKDVFERCTSTGSEALSFFICLDANKFVLIIFFSLIKTIYPRFWTKPLPIDGKSQFPVDVRPSKTLLRKLPINLPNSFMFPIPGTSWFSFKRWMSRLIWAFLWHSWDSFLRTQSIGAKRWACSYVGGGHFHFRCFESCREVDYPSFCFDDSYRMVVHLLLVLSYGFCDLPLFLFFVNFNQTQEIVFCGYLSRYPSSERELKIKTKLFYQLRGAWIPHEALRVGWSSKARKRFVRFCFNFDQVVCMSFEREKSYLITSLIRSYATQFVVHDTIRVAGSS